MKQKDIMIDIETLGTRPDSVITEIAAARFDILTGEIEDSIFYPVDWTGQPGRVIYPDTVAWWMVQDDEARGKMLDSRASLAHVLEYLKVFIQRSGFDRDEIIWTNGPEFDMSILTHAYQHDPMTIKLHKGETPWEFWNTRDCRTMRAVSRGIVNHKDFARGQQHNAMDDVKFQVRYVSAMWRALRGDA